MGTFGVYLALKGVGCAFLSPDAFCSYRDPVVVHIWRPKWGLFRRSGGKGWGGILFDYYRSQCCHDIAHRWPYPILCDPDTKGAEQLCGTHVPQRNRDRHRVCTTIHAVRNRVPGDLRDTERSRDPVFVSIRNVHRA